PTRPGWTATPPCRRRSRPRPRWPRASEPGKARYRMAESVGTVHHPHGAGHGHGHEEQSFASKYLFSTDHKVIGMQYMFTGMFMALIGGFFAYGFRMQMAFPGMSVPGLGVIYPTEYNALITNHGAIMIFWVAMPILIAAFGNFLIPLMVGCDDMVFPKINRLSHHVFLPPVLA